MRRIFTKIKNLRVLIKFEIIWIMCFIISVILRQSHLIYDKWLIEFELHSEITIQGASKTALPPFESCILKRHSDG